MLGATFCVPFIVFLKGMTIWITYLQPAPVAVVGSNPTKVDYLQRICLIIVCEWTKNERMFVFVQRAVRSCALRTSRFSAFLRSRLSFGSLKREKTTVYQSIYISATSKVFCLHRSSALAVAELSKRGGESENGTTLVREEHLYPISRFQDTRTWTDSLVPC